MKRRLPKVCPIGPGLGRGNVCYSKQESLKGMSGLGKLQLIQLCIDTVLFHEFSVRTLLNDASIMHDQYRIGLENCRKTVRNDDRSSPRKRNLERPLYGSF